MTTRYGDIADTFGSGGANVVPGGAQGSPSMRDAHRAALGAITQPYADSTALTASLAKHRVDGQIAVKLDDYTKWTWKAASTTATGTTVIAPTDVGVGAGRWVREDAIESDSDTAATVSYADGTQTALTTGATNTQDAIDALKPLVVQHVSTDLPLATIQGKTSGAAFNVGAALPANAQVLRSQIQVVQVIGGGTISACTAQLQNTGETAGALLGGSSGVDVHAAAGNLVVPVGSNPAVSRGGQQLQLTLTSTGDTLAHATTGHLKVDVFYTNEA